MQFDSLSVMEFVINESLPLGYVITQLKAYVVNGFDEGDEQIRFDSLIFRKIYIISITYLQSYIVVKNYIGREKTRCVTTL